METTTRHRREQQQLDRGLAIFWVIHDHGPIAILEIQKHLPERYQENCEKTIYRSVETLVRNRAVSYDRNARLVAAVLVPADSR